MTYSCSGRRYLPQSVNSGVSPLGGDANPALKYTTNEGGNEDIQRDRDDHSWMTMFRIVANTVLPCISKNMRHHFCQNWRTLLAAKRACMDTESFVAFAFIELLNGRSYNARCKLKP